MKKNIFKKKIYSTERIFIKKSNIYNYFYKYSTFRKLYLEEKL